MSTSKEANRFVAVIGAGPAGLYAAQTLAEAGVRVALFNRDVKPGGLAEYGIYHDKQKMKDGLRRQFREILSNPAIDYYGNIVVGQHGDLTLDDLRQLGAEAILVTVGAQGTKWLGLPGEDLLGVYHAKDIVYHYNQLPPYTEQPFHIGRRVALVGAGNVMMDVAHWLIRDVKVDEVIAVVRRGPAEVKFSKKEMLPVICHVDRQALNQEFERVAPVMLNIGQDPVAAKTFMLSAGDKGIEPTSQTVFRFDFLASPSRIEGDAQGNVCALEVEDTTLVPANGDTKAKGLGTRRLVEVDTVVFCIGDRVDSDFGLPVEWNEYVKNPTPRFPVEGLSYEVFDPAVSQPIDDVFVAGWARKASDGLVGVARKDGTQGARAVEQYLATLPELTEAELADRQNVLIQHLQQLDKPVVTKAAWQRLEKAEQAEASKQGLESFKYGTNGEMLAAMGL